MRSGQLRKGDSKPILIVSECKWVRTVSTNDDDQEYVEDPLNWDRTESVAPSNKEESEHRFHMSGATFALSITPEPEKAMPPPPRGVNNATAPTGGAHGANLNQPQPERKKLGLKLNPDVPAFVPKGLLVPVATPSPPPILVADGSKKGDVPGVGVTKEVLASSYAKESQMILEREGDGEFCINYDEPRIRRRVLMSDFEVLKMVGEGAYGRVFQVRHIASGKVYAMKTLKKKFLINSNNVDYTFTERNVLRRVQHPFVVGLHFAFQTKGKVCLVMDFLNGGQIFYHLKRQTMFQEEEVRFYAVEIALALSHLHSLGIIHRDLKPENILLDSQGHVHLTDFGLARDFGSHADGTTATYCGTVEYMAPEMIQGHDYTISVDWWSMGVLLYDMMTGSPPWTHKNEKTLCDMITTAKLTLPSYLSPEAQSLLMGLLQRDPEKRFTAKDITGHPWFEGMDWDAILRKEVEPPWLPTNINGDLDTLNFESKYIQRKLNAQSPSDMADDLSRSQEALFVGFSYVRSVEDRPPF